MKFRFFNALNRRILGRRLPDRAYYWLWDRVGNGSGWRPLHMRHPDYVGPWRPTSWHEGRK